MQNGLQNATDNKWGPPLELKWTFLDYLHKIQSRNFLGIQGRKRFDLTDIYELKLIEFRLSHFPSSQSNLGFELNSNLDKNSKKETNVPANICIQKSSKLSNDQIQ